MPAYQAFFSRLSELAANAERGGKQLILDVQFRGSESKWVRMNVRNVETDHFEAKAHGSNDVELVLYQDIRRVKRPEEAKV